MKIGIPKVSDILERAFPVPLPYPHTGQFLSPRLMIDIGTP